MTSTKKRGNNESSGRVSLTEGTTSRLLGNHLHRVAFNCATDLSQVSLFGLDIRIWWEAFFFTLWITWWSQSHFPFDFQCHACTKFKEGKNSRKEYNHGSIKEQYVHLEISRCKESSIIKLVLRSRYKSKDDRESPSLSTFIWCQMKRRSLCSKTRRSAWRRNRVLRQELS